MRTTRSGKEPMAGRNSRQARLHSGLSRGMERGRHPNLERQVLPPFCSPKRGRRSFHPRPSGSSSGQPLPRRGLHICHRNVQWSYND
ncbi:hypothetical protein QOT17_021726 [Balamuthia mandrillaris]